MAGDDLAAASAELLEDLAGDVAGDDLAAASAELLEDLARDRGGAGDHWYQSVARAR